MSWVMVSALPGWPVPLAGRAAAGADRVGRCRAPGRRRADQRLDQRAVRHLGLDLVQQRGDLRVRRADHDRVADREAERTGHLGRDDRVHAADAHRAEPADPQCLRLPPVHLHGAAQRQLVLRPMV